MQVSLIRAKYHSVWEPLNLMYLTAYIRKFSDIPVEVTIHDCYFEKDKNIIDACQDSDIVGISGTTPQLTQMLTLSEQIKDMNPKIRVVLGGYGPSLEPIKCLNNSSVDHIVVGEGERSLLSIIKGEKKRVVNYPPVDNLDEFPFPDREAVNLERYISIAKREEGRRVTSVLASRGCPYGCTFCADGKFGTIWGEISQVNDEIKWTCKKKIRIRKPHYVLEELDQVQKRYGIEFFKFSDAEINHSKKFVLDLCREMCFNNWKTPWGANFHVANIDEEICDWLVKAGCTETWFGVESGAPEILRHINKGSTIEKIVQAFKITKKCGLQRRAYFILGTPPESRETIRETEALIEQIDPDVVSFSLLAPYPGTIYWRPEFKDIDWSKVDEYSNTIWSSEHLTNKELRGEQLRLTDMYKDRLAPIVQKKKRLGIINNKNK